MPEPPIEIEPMTYALRETRSLPAHALAALIAQKIALTLAALGLSKGPVPRPLPFVTPSLFTVCNVTEALGPGLPARCRCALTLPTADLPIAARRANSGWHCVTSRLLLGND